MRKESPGYLLPYLLGGQAGTTYCIADSPDETTTPGDGQVSYRDSGTVRPSTPLEKSGSCFFKAASASAARLPQARLDGHPYDNGPAAIQVSRTLPWLLTRAPSDVTFPRAVVSRDSITTIRPYACLSVRSFVRPRNRNWVVYVQLVLPTSLVWYDL